MADQIDHSTTPLESMTILNFPETGKKVVEWAQNPSTRPRDIVEFRQQLAGLVDVPARYKEIQISQGYDHVFFLRLPPNNQVTQSQQKLETETNSVSAYGFPQFYFDAIEHPEKFDRTNFFFSRIADYTIRGCRRDLLDRQRFATTLRNRQARKL